MEWWAGLTYGARAGARGELPALLCMPLGLRLMVMGEDITSPCPVCSACAPLKGLRLDRFMATTGDSGPANETVLLVLLEIHDIIAYFLKPIRHALARSKTLFYIEIRRHVGLVELKADPYLSRSSTLACKPHFLCSQYLRLALGPTACEALATTAG